MAETDAPVLAVVGHPNKGKSSLVATLSEDDSVGIGPTPGTTLETRAYPLRVDGRTLYTLVDTPGFQRARRVLAWLEARAEAQGASAADRPRLVAEFVSAPGHRDRFPDECELLRPLVEGAGILYVVDGSVPYGPEYEAEMEILRWTGRPSLAVVNPISSDAHVESWQTALGQFFRVVRVVDAVHADFATRRRLLQAFAEIDADFRQPIEEAIHAIERARATRRESTAREIARLIGEALGYSVERRIEPHVEAAPLEVELRSEWEAGLRRHEQSHRERVQALWGYRSLDATASELELLEGDLFSEQTWLLFGLRPRDFAAVGAVGGATAGAVIDAAVGGASFLVGSFAGAAIGGVLGWLGAGRLAELRVVERPMGGRLLRYGPSTNSNLPFVLFARARFHAGLLASRTHAQRGSIEIDVDLAERLPLEAEERRSLAEGFAAIRKATPGSARSRDASKALTRIADAILASDEQRAANIP